MSVEGGGRVGRVRAVPLAFDVGVSAAVPVLYRAQTAHHMSKISHRRARQRQLAMASTY